MKISPSSDGVGESYAPKNQVPIERFHLKQLSTKNIEYSEKAYIRLENIRENIAGIRIIGSAAYSLALVASGKLDGYFEGTVGLLDTAAGVLLVQEAGGIVSDFWGQGKEYFEKNVTYVSGNKSAHLYIVEKINNT